MVHGPLVRFSFAILTVFRSTLLHTCNYKKYQTLNNVRFKFSILSVNFRKNVLISYLNRFDNNHPLRPSLKKCLFAIAYMYADV